MAPKLNISKTVAPLKIQNNSKMLKLNKFDEEDQSYEKDVIDDFMPIHIDNFRPLVARDHKHDFEAAILPMQYTKNALNSDRADGANSKDNRMSPTAIRFDEEFDAYVNKKLPYLEGQPDFYDEKKKAASLRNAKSQKQFNNISNLKQANLRQYYLGTAEQRSDLDLLLEVQRLPGNEKIKPSTLLHQIQTGRIKPGTLVPSEADPTSDNSLVEHLLNKRR